MQRFNKLLTRKNISWLLVALGVAGIGISILLYISEPKSTKAFDDPNTVSVDSAPSSAKLSEQTVATYTVPVKDPKYISIPSLGIGITPVVKLGLLKSGAIATPDNIFETGWFDGSSLPGQDGAMFIYGHVSSWTAKGIFYNLKKLVAGDKIIITRGDNKTFSYIVVSLKIYPYNSVPMRQVLSPIDPHRPGLNLMTCTGQIIKGTSEFNERLVVFTSLVG